MYLTIEYDTLLNLDLLIAGLVKVKSRAIGKQRQSRQSIGLSPSHQLGQASNNSRFSEGIPLRTLRRGSLHKSEA